MSSYEASFKDKRTGKEYCPNHPTKLWDRDRFPNGCYWCYLDKKKKEEEPKE